MTLHVFEEDLTEDWMRDVAGIERYLALYAAFEFWVACRKTDIGESAWTDNDLTALERDPERISFWRGNTA